MAFVNRLSLVTPSFGTSISNDAQNLRQTVSLSGASTTTTIPSSGSFSPAPRTGWVRVKLTNGGSSSTVGAITLSFTDGTATTVFGAVGAQAVPNVAGSGIDHIFPFETDLVVTSMTVTVALTVGTTTATLDVEIAYSN